MKTARMTVLMTPIEKANVEASASRLGMSSSEYVRLAVDNFEQPTAEEEAELAALVAEVNIAIPKMEESLRRSCETLERTHREVDAFLREAGLRS